MRSDASGSLLVWGSAFVGAVSATICMAALSAPATGMSAMEIAASAGALFVGIVAVTLLRGSKGFILLWGVLLAAWLLWLYGALNSERWILAQAVRVLPVRFVYWSVAALPLWLATTFALHTQGSRPRTWLGTISFVLGWIALMAISSQLASYAIDVGLNPLERKPVFWGMALFLPATPLLISWLMIHRLKHDH